MVIKCPDCGGQVSDQAQTCPHCGAPISPPQQNNSEGCCLFGMIKAVLAFILTLAIGLGIVAGVKSISAPKTSRTSGFSSYSSVSSGTKGSAPTPTQRPTTKAAAAPTSFADDAEEVVKTVKEGFSNTDIKTSWFINGTKLSVTLRVNELSSTDLRDMYYTDSDAQSTVNALAQAAQKANKSSCDLLKMKGYKDFTVVFSMITSDGFEMVTTENGEITYCISADNFRLG